jgi:hypothetical protein
MRDSQRKPLDNGIIFNNLANSESWSSRCLQGGMNFWMILLAAQVLVAIIAFARGTRQDSRFEDDKLDFRS